MDRWYRAVLVMHFVPRPQTSTWRHSTYGFYQAFHHVSCDWRPGNEATYQSHVCLVRSVKAAISPTIPVIVASLWGYLRRDCSVFMSLSSETRTQSAISLYLYEQWTSCTPYTVTSSGGWTIAVMRSGLLSLKHWRHTHSEYTAMLSLITLVDCLHIRFDRLT